MKRKFLAGIATAIILFSTTLLPAGSFLLSSFGAQTAHAQAQVGDNDGTCNPAYDTVVSQVPTASTPALCSNGTATGFNGGPAGPWTWTCPAIAAGGTTDNCTATLSPSANVNNPTTPNTQTPGSSSLSCSASGGIFDGMLCALVEFTSFLMTSITSLVANVAAIILDFSIHYSISSSTYSNTTVNTILVSGWKMIRDFSTIFLMFALFVVAFMLIFNAEGSEGSWAAHFSPGRTIARVIIVALLVNFSFLLCRSVIEVGNIFAQVLYNKIDQGNQSVQNYPTNGTINQTAVGIIGLGSQAFVGTPFAGTKSISVGLLANINPQRVLLSANNATLIGSSGSSLYIAYLFVSFVSAILNLIMIFIFVSMALLFIGRVIGLYLGVILSPFAFVSWTIPFLQNMPFIGFDNWLKELIGFTFLGPVYLLFVYLTVAFMQIQQPNSTASLLATSAFAIIDALLCVFVLLKGKKIAESMAGEFGQMIARGASVVATAGVGLATGGTAFVASQTVGRAGSAVATNGTVNRLADSGKNEEAVQQRMQAASNFRSKKFLGYQVGKTKLGQAIGGSIERGDFNRQVLTGKAFGAVKGFGKTVATVSPLDANIAGTSIRKGTAAVANATGNKNLATSLAKDYTSGIKDATIKGRAIDIAGIRNKNATITNQSNKAVAGGLGDFAASMNPQATKNAGGTESGGPKITAAGTASGLTGVPLTTPATATTPPTNPPNNPPTGGATPPNQNIPPKNTPLPARQQSTPLNEEAQSGVTHTRNLFTGGVNFDRPEKAPETEAAKEPEKNGILDQFGNYFKKNTPTSALGTTTPVVEKEKPEVKIVQVPATQSSSSSVELLSAIHGQTEAVQKVGEKVDIQTEKLIQSQKEIAEKNAAKETLQRTASITQRNNSSLGPDVKK